MPNLIRDGQVCTDDLNIIAKGTASEASGRVLVNIDDWNNKTVSSHAKVVGLWFDSDQPPSLLESDPNQFGLIAINFPAFSDGRGYSYAHILRAQMGYTGELRAIGDVLRDQLFFLKRCGFNAFAVRADRDINQALDSLSDFGNTYQAAIDDSSPLFKKRWS